jgi:segregation and condensation protein A
MDFTALAGQSDNKVHFVYNFLAILEMLQQQLLEIEVGMGFNNFSIKEREVEVEES